MKNFSFLVCFVIISACTAQENTILVKKRNNKCEKLVNLKQYGYKNSFKDSTLVDYLLTSKSIPLKDISDIESCEEINAEFSTADYFVFTNDSIKIQLAFTTDSLTNPGFEIEWNNEDEFATFIYKINDYEPIGLLAEQNQFTLFKSFQVIYNNEVFEAPKEIYKDLFSPNLFEKYKSLAPIKSFISDDKSMIYVYVMGNNRKIDEVSDRSVSANYIAKIIFDLKEKTFRRYLLLYPELMTYGFDCPDFSGF